MAPLNAIAVIGAGDADEATRAMAFKVGHAIARNGVVLVCGGRGGVREAAAQGARTGGGHTVGILPSYNRASANSHIEFAIATGMGEARNTIVVASADAVIALPGEAGTLSEIALALKIGRPVVALGAWYHIEGVHRAEDAEAAVALALQLGGIALRDEKRDD
jgi:uncharacterized protein (TIGR00725 family)